MGLFSSKKKTYITTESKQYDLRTIQEQTGEGIQIGPQGTYAPKITYEAYDAAPVMEVLLTNQGSAMARVLDLTEKLAGGVFEKSGEIVKSVAEQGRRSTESMLAAMGREPALPAIAREIGLPGGTVAIAVCAVGVGLLIFLRR